MGIVLGLPTLLRDTTDPDVLLINDDELVQLIAVVVQDVGEAGRNGGELVGAKAQIDDAVMGMLVERDELAKVTVSGEKRSCLVGGDGKDVGIRERTRVVLDDKGGHRVPAGGGSVLYLLFCGWPR
jgi:hypothetical protein